MLSFSFRAFRLVLYGDSHVKINTENRRQIVGHLMTDDEKIAYILKTDDDIESASDRIADIYYKQMIGG